MNPYGQPQQWPLNPAAFQHIKDRVSQESFSSGRQQLIDAVARDPNNWFTSEQVRELVMMMSFSSEKVHAAVTLYSKVVDKEKFYIVVDSMTFNSEKDEVRKRLGIY